MSGRSAHHTSRGPSDYDDPARLAALVADSRRPLLIGLDIDGVLAPIVTHADDAELLPGMAAAIAHMAGAERVTIAAVSGRSLESMRRFGLPPTTRLIGSHGMEEDGAPVVALDAQEATRLAALRELADRAARDAGVGAWVESKIASVALHVREAEPALAARAIAALEADADAIDGAHTKHGSEVLELFARSTSKGTAVRRLTMETDAATTVFVGDDITDEEAFAALRAGDISIKVGDAPTIAAHRLVDPHAVLIWLETLADRLTPPVLRGQTPL